MLRIHHFRQLWIGQAISQLGDSLYFLVFLFMAGKLSGGDPQVVGLVGAAQSIPFLFFGPIGGMLADRMDRRKIMIAADLFSTLLMASFAVSLLFNPTPSVWLIGTVGFLLSVANIFFLPARSASIPRLVPTDKLMEANGLIMSTQNFIGMIGIALSASVLGLLSVMFPNYFFFAACALNALTFFGSAFFASRLPSLVPLREETEEKAKSMRHQAWDDIRIGLKAVFANPVMRIALPINVGICLFISGFFPLYLKTNDLWFGGKFSTLAWIEFTFMVPLAVMSLLMGKFNIVRPGLAYAWALIATGVCIFAMGWGQNFWVYVAWNIVCGLALPFAWIPMSTYMQFSFPDELRGRVNSVWTTISQGIQPVSLILVGGLLNVMPLVTFYVVIGLAMIAIPAMGLLSAGFRNGRYLHLVDSESTTAEADAVVEAV